MIALQKRAAATVVLPPLVLDRNEAAAVLRISIRKLDYLIEGGSINPVRIDARVLVAWDELQRFVESISARAHSQAESCRQGAEPVEVG